MSQANHERIITLYSTRDERAGAEAEALYGYACMKMARHILDHERQAEACVQKALEIAWERLHTDAPASAELYLLRATRSLAIDLFRSQGDAKRGDSLFLRTLDELGECIPCRKELYGLSSSEESEAIRVGEAVNAFLQKYKREAREVFICRYFYGDSVSEITDRFGLSTKQVYTLLLRTRLKLARHLEELGVTGVSSPELAAMAMNHISDELLLSPCKPHRKVRRWIPAAIAVGCVALLAVSFPYLRNVINTDLVLRSPNWRNENQEGDAELPITPDEEDIRAVGDSITLGSATVTLEELTETTATYTVVKTDSTPIYAAVYDRMGDALASTEPDYKVDGVVIRHGTLRIYVDGSEKRLDQLPSAAGTYRVTVDFSVIRNGTYPMSDYMGFYAYVGKDGAPVTHAFTLILPESPAETEEASAEELTSTEDATE